MNHNIEFLNYIYQNAEMGVESMTQISAVVDNADFAAHIKAQLDEYTIFSSEAKKMLNAANHQEKQINGLLKVATYCSIALKTLTDKSPSHLSAMLISGSTMGIIDATRNINKYVHASSEVVDLARRLLKMEEQNVEQLKKFL